MRSDGLGQVVGCTRLTRHVIYSTGLYPSHSATQLNPATHIVTQMSMNVPGFDVIYGYHGYVTMDMDLDLYHAMALQALLKTFCILPRNLYHSSP